MRMRHGQRSRLDVLMVAKGLASSRERARAYCLAGRVTVNGLSCSKPGTLVAEDADIRVAGEPLPFVSRGGLKLLKAIQVFGLDFTGKIVLDVGASTGGFTDCALQHGAAHVYAVDVGYGQIAWKLRNDPRVTVLERTNIRHLTASALSEPPDIATIDVSFISLGKVFPAVIGVLRDPGLIVALVKPQFEAGRNKVGKRGVVREKAVHSEVLTRVLADACAQGLKALNLTYSPIQGPEGNIEFLLCLGTFLFPAPSRNFSVEEIVNEAHSFFSAPAEGDPC